MKIYFFFLFCLTPLFAELSTQKEMELLEQLHSNVKKEGAVTFLPPTGWHLADPNALPPCVKTMVVGKGKYEFPPSLNLSIEPFAGSLKDYLNIIKEINASKGQEWKELGSIQTKAGKASLSQVSSKSEWGEVRMMHAVLLKDSQIYILTGAAIKEEFPTFYHDFFQAMRSFDINPVVKKS